MAIDLGRAGAALAGLAVPAQRQVGSLLALNLHRGIEHHHPFRDFGLVIFELAAVGVPAPNSKGGSGHYCISLIICFSSSGMSGIGACVTSISPSGPLRTMVLT